MHNTLVMRLLNQDYAEFDTVSKVAALTLIGVLAPGFKRHPGSKLSEAYGYSVLFRDYTTDNLITFLGEHGDSQRDTAEIMRLVFRFEEAAQRVPLFDLTYMLRELLSMAMTDTTQQMMLICASEFILQNSLVQTERQAESHSYDRDEDEDLGPHHNQSGRPDRDPDLERMAALAMQVGSSQYPALPEDHWLQTGHLSVVDPVTSQPITVNLNDPTEPLMRTNPKVILASHLQKFINAGSPPFEDMQAFLEPLFQLVDVSDAIKEAMSRDSGARMPSLEDVYPRDPQHWLYQPLPAFPPMGMRTGLGHNPSFRYQLNAALVEAVHYAIQVATRGGTELPLDIDRIVQNTMVGLFGFNTTDGLPEGAALEGFEVPPLFDYSVAQSMQPPLQPAADKGQDLDHGGALVEQTAGEGKSTVAPPKKPRARTSKPRTRKTKAHDKGPTE